MNEQNLFDTLDDILNAVVGLKEITPTNAPLAPIDALIGRARREIDLLRHDTRAQSPPPIVVTREDLGLEPSPNHITLGDTVTVDWIRRNLADSRIRILRQDEYSTGESTHFPFLIRTSPGVDDWTWRPTDAYGSYDRLQHAHRTADQAMDPFRNGYQGTTFIVHAIDQIEPPAPSLPPWRGESQHR